VDAGQADRRDRGVKESVVIVRDPVCGMRFPAEQAAVTMTLNPYTSIFYFCSESCRGAFVTDPVRYLDLRRRAASNDPEDSGSDVGLEPSTSALRDPVGGERVCPYCHETTEIDRGPGVRIEGIRLHELEALVRSEWRRRLGSESYHRRHPEQLIRALALYALIPNSPVLEDELESSIWDVVAELASETKSRTEIQHELGELVMAIRTVLKSNGVPWDRILTLTDPVRTWVESVMDWPGGLAVSSKSQDA
jgi:YHS domain-containing protein